MPRGGNTLGSIIHSSSPVSSLIILIHQGQWTKIVIRDKRQLTSLHFLLALPTHQGLHTRKGHA